MLVFPLICSSSVHCTLFPSVFTLSYSSLLFGWIPIVLSFDKLSVTLFYKYAIYNQLASIRI